MRSFERLQSTLDTVKGGEKVKTKKRRAQMTI